MIHPSVYMHVYVCTYLIKIIKHLSYIKVTAAWHRGCTASAGLLVTNKKEGGKGKKWAGGGGSDEMH